MQNNKSGTLRIVSGQAQYIFNFLETLFGLAIKLNLKYV